MKHYIYGLIILLMGFVYSKEISGEPVVKEEHVTLNDSNQVRPIIPIDKQPSTEEDLFETITLFDGQTFIDRHRFSFYRRYGYTLSLA